MEEIKNMKKWTSKRWLPEAWKRTMEDAKSKLKYYEDILKKKKKALVKEKKVNNNDITTLQNIFTELGDIDYDIHKWQWGEYSNTAGYPYNSPEIARKSNKRQIEDLQFNQNFQKELREWAISTIFNWNIQKTNDFLRRIAQREYDEADYQTYIRNAAIINPCLQRYGIPMPNDPKWRISGWNFERSPRTSRTTNDYRNLDRWEAFQQWWLAWIVDKALSNCNNLTPWQRNTWKNIAVLWGYAAWIYWLFKFFTNKNMWFWTKAWITATAIFWSQALTWENPITLFNKLLTWWFSKEELESKFWNAFWDAVDWVHNSSIEGAENISWAMYSLMVFNKTTKVWEVRALSTRFKNNPQEWSLFRWQAIENLGTKNFERFSATFSENFDEAKWNSWLNSIGIHDGIDDNKLVYELATVKTMNAIVINKFLSDNWVKVTDDKTKKEEYEQYIKSMNDNNQAIDVDVLKSHMEKNDRFKQDNEATFTDREKDKDNRKALEDQVEALSIDAQKKAELKTAIIRFYDERTIDSKPELSDFSLKIENWLLVLSSHGWHEAKININNWELDWFWKGIRFSSLSDLINTADIANKVLESQKGKLPKDLPVFQYKPERKWICFNDATSIWQDIVNRNNSWMDTRVLSTWRLWATSKIETLSKHPEDYATYLSERWIKENKINIDSTLYPTVKTLSESWIIFTNEQEVKNLEDWLKWIKENLKFAVSTPDGNPFSITFTNKLEFKAVNGDSKDFPENISEKFPTLLRTWNKEKFLKIMNDPNNKMRWSN